MATKPVKKQTTKKKRKATSAMPVSANQYTSVDIRKADNGFVISTYSDKGKSKTFVAKDKPEMQQISKKLLGIK